jgi:hypothetical protein
MPNVWRGPLGAGSHHRRAEQGTDDGGSTVSIRSRLTRLEAQVRAGEFNGDVFADIERDTAHLAFFLRQGEWSPDMTPDEYRQLETDMLQILGRVPRGI